MKRFKEQTATSKVESALRAADDFLTMRQVKTATGLSSNHVSAALIHLRKYKAADCLSSDGQLHWYATPETDTRTKVVEERCPESKPRRPRKTKRGAKQ